MESLQKERRTTRRKSHRECVAVHLELERSDGAKERVIDTCVLDVSPLGIRISCGVPVPEGTTVCLVIRAERSGLSFRLKGRVQWCHRPSPYHDHEIGFAISPLEDSDFERWGRFVDDLQEERS